MNIIETHRLTRRFGRQDAVHDLDLSVPAGSTYALLGANGAGKTTTIKLLMNLLAPSAGSAAVLGEDSRRLGPPQLARIGYVSENARLPLWMSVADLLAYCRPLYPTWDRDLERKLLRKLELPEDRKLGQLSRGMLMKAALLSSLAFRPTLLVLDEPFTGLDPLVRDELIHGILEISEVGDWTVFVSSHDIAEVEQLCDHVAILSEGRRVLEEPVDDVQARFRRMEVVLHDEPAGLPAGLPGDWLLYQREGGRVGFVDSAYNAGGTERLCRAHFPAAEVTAIPMSLREIFVTIARMERTRKGEAA